MTLFDFDEEQAPPLPGVSGLAQELDKLLHQLDGPEAEASARLEGGLSIHASLQAEGPRLTLERARGQPSQQEADTVARALAWPHFQVLVDGRRIHLQRLQAPPTEPPPKRPPIPREIKETLISAILSLTEPYFLRNSIREDALRAMKDDELREEYVWMRRRVLHHPCPGVRDAQVPLLVSAEILAQAGIAPDSDQTGPTVAHPPAPSVVSSAQPGTSPTH